MANKERRFSLFPKPLHESVERVTQPVFKRFGLAQARLVSDWPQIAGELLAQKALPVRIQFPKGKRDGGVLHLNVDTGWATEIQHLEPVILEKIATYFGYKAVARIHITQQPIARKPVAERIAPPPPPELSPTQRDALAQSLQNVNDPELKAALEKLGEGIFAQKAYKHKAP